MADTVVHLVTENGKNIKKLAASALAAFFLLSVTVAGVLATPSGDRVQKMLRQAKLNELQSLPPGKVVAANVSGHHVVDSTESPAESDRQLTKRSPTLEYLAEGISTSANNGAAGSAAYSATVDPASSNSSVQPAFRGIDSAKQSIISDSKKKAYLDVPVPFLSDRNNQLTTNDAYRKHSVDQVIGSKHVWLGVAHVAVWANDLSPEDLVAAERWGCKRITYKEAHKPYYTHFEKQLKDTGMTVCIPSLKDESECHPFKNEQYSSFQKTIAQLLEKSESKEYLIFLHGCCTSQKMALEQTATMALAFHQPVIAFDWATVGPINAPPLPEVNTYRRSERALEISQVLFDLWMNELLKEVSPRNVSLFAHSMGNRIVKDYLLKQNDSFGKFKQVHFIRPDMSAQPFFMQERTITNLANDTFVYYANNDPWLSWSAAASASVPRLGRMEDLIDRVKEEGASYGPPGCSFLIDISSLGHKHQIPENLIKDVWKNGVQSEILAKKLIREIPDRDRILRVAIPQRAHNH